MSNEKEIRDLFAKHNVSLLHDDVWQVQRVYVIKHKALERLAVAIGLRWDMPQILRAERDEAVVLIAAEHPNGAREWSIGEARIVPMVDSGRTNQWGKPIYEPADGATGNYQITPKQSAYPYAMAEKRAKDRVIIKLAGLHGAYSEEEADDFKQQRQPEPVVAHHNHDVEWSQTKRDALIKAMDMAESEQDLAEWFSSHRSEIEALLEADRQCVRAAYKDHLMALRNQRAA